MPCPVSVPCPAPRLSALPASAQRPGFRRRRRPAPVPCPTPWEEGYYQPQTVTPTPGSRDSRPPCLYARAGHHIEISVYTVLSPGKTPAEKDPPGCSQPKNFHMKNSSGIYPTMVAIATRWQTLEGISGREMKSFMAVGKALLTIRDQRLYREQGRRAGKRSASRLLYHSISGRRTLSSAAHLRS